MNPLERDRERARTSREAQVLCVACGHRAFEHWEAGSNKDWGDGTCKAWVPQHGPCACPRFYDTDIDLILESLAPDETVESRAKPSSASDWWSAFWTQYPTRSSGPH